MKKWLTGIKATNLTKKDIHLQTASEQSSMACSAKHACSVQIHRVCVCVCGGEGGRDVVNCTLSPLLYEISKHVR